MTVAELSEVFIERYALRRLKPTTVRGYKVNIEKYILRYLGLFPIESVKYRDIDAAVNGMFSLGLSSRSVVYMLATLSKIFAYGIKQEFCDRNPVAFYDYPKIKRYDYTVLTLNDFEKLLISAKDSTYYPAYLLACHYGLRRGECFGVKMSDISGDVLKVSRSVNSVYKESLITTPKNGKFRFIKLLPYDIYELKKYDKNRPCSSSRLLIRTINGEEVSPNAVNKDFKKVLKSAGLGKVRFHDLRHSYATIMMENGINPKIVSEVLGHSSVDITLDIYSHCNTKMQDVCLDVIRKKG